MRSYLCVATVTIAWVLVGGLIRGTTAFGQAPEGRAAEGLEDAERRSDEQLRRDVENALAFDPATESLEISVSVQDAVATLLGTVNSSTEKMLAERVARTVQGLRDVRNSLVVRYRQRQRPSPRD